MEQELKIIGWREWVRLPELGIERIKAKIDTGARTSALHAFSIDRFQEDRKDKVRFAIHPIQKNSSKVIVSVADLVDVRWVTDSGGHKEERYVIRTKVCLGNTEWPIEVTLTNRDSMAFRMLLGRTAIRHKFYVDSAKSYLIGRRKDLYENRYTFT